MMKGIVAVSVLLSFLCVSGVVYAIPVEWKVPDGGNGHFYEIVLSPTGIAFVNAKAAAIAMGGHLATPDMSGEANFIYNNLTKPAAANQWGDYWLGAYSSGSGQAWYWVTGGEVTAWGGSPYFDSFEGNVPYGLMQTPNNWWTSPAALQDLNQSTPISGFVVEYAPVPIPGALWLLAPGLLGLVGLKRRYLG